MALQVRDIHKTYHLEGETIRALRGVSLDIDQNEYVAIMGASGSGKSTMLGAIREKIKPLTGGDSNAFDFSPVVLFFGFWFLKRIMTALFY